MDPTNQQQQQQPQQQPQYQQYPPQYQQQYPQQYQQYSPYAPPKTLQQIETEDYYKKISTKLTDILATNASGTIDPYSLQSVMTKYNTTIPKERMGDFFKHLLYYTYASTAAEISNHQEVNKQLDEIKKTLSKLIKEEPVIAPVAAST